MVVQPDAEAFALCNGNVGTGVIAEQSVPATGGSFSVSAAVTEPAVARRNAGQAMRMAGRSPLAGGHDGDVGGPSAAREEFGFGLAERSRGRREVQVLGSDGAPVRPGS